MSAPLRKTLTVKDQALVDYIISHPELSESACARACGWKVGSSSKVLGRIRDAINARKEKKSAAVDKAAIKKALISKNVIEERALAIAMSGTGKPAVDALRLLADMGGHIIHQSRDLTGDLKDKSPEELEYFSTHGYWPTTVDAGEPGAAESKSSSQIPSEPEKKPN